MVYLVWPLQERVPYFDCYWVVHRVCHRTCDAKIRPSGLTCNFFQQHMWHQLVCRLSSAAKKYVIHITLYIFLVDLFTTLNFLIIMYSSKNEVSQLGKLRNVRYTVLPEHWSSYRVRNAIGLVECLMFHTSRRNLTRTCFPRVLASPLRKSVGDVILVVGGCLPAYHNPAHSPYSPPLIFSPPPWWFLFSCSGFSSAPTVFWLGAVRGILCVR